jgi:flagellar motor switch protein FliN/FliY
VDIPDLDTSKGFLLLFPFRSGFSGKMAFLLQHREASILADLILGGEGVAKDSLDEADLDALKEAMSQVTGSGAPTLSATLGIEVGFDPPEVQEVEAGQLTQPLPWQRAFLGVGTVKVDNVLETPLRILLPLEVAQEMASVLNEEEQGAPASPSAPPLSSAPEESPLRTTAEATGEVRNIDLILDIEVEVMVRLGETEMALKEIQRLRPGSIIDLDKDTEAPVELVVNDKVIAKGELVVVSSDHFALRITDIETPSERIRRLGA